MNKCSFCKQSCGHEHCDFSNGTFMKKSKLDVNIQESFEAGKIIGKQEVLTELYELSIIDVSFKNYIAARLKSLNDSIELIKKYKLL